MELWLEDVTTEQLVFLRSIASIIRHSEAATIANDKAAKDIKQELIDRGKIGHYDTDDKNVAVKTWLKCKKREFRRRMMVPGNGYHGV